MDCANHGNVPKTCLLLKPLEACIKMHFALEKNSKKVIMSLQNYINKLRNIIVWNEMILILIIIDKVQNSNICGLESQKNIMKCFIIWEKYATVRPMA